MLKRKAGEPDIPDATKKTKISETRDVPSSNFSYSSLQKLRTAPPQQQIQQSNSSSSSGFSYADLKKKAAQASSQVMHQQQPQQSSTTQQRPTNPLQQKQSKQPISIIQQQQDGSKKVVLPLKVDPQKILQRLALPPNLKQVLPPDYQKLKEYAKKKEIKKQLLQRMIKDGKIKMPEKKVEEEVEDSEAIKQMQNVHMNELGELRDDKGNLIKITNSNKATIKFNKRKIQQDKYQQWMKMTGMSQKNSLVYDTHVVMTTNQKRDKRKAHALHFIEKGSIAMKADALRKKIQSEDQETGNKDQQNANQSGDNNQINGQNQQSNSNEQQQQLHIKEENQIMMNEANLPTGLKRVSIKIKHHDPIPNVEWWDLPLLDNKKSYIAGDYQQQSHQQQSQQMEQEQQKLEQNKQLIELEKNINDNSLTQEPKQSEHQQINNNISQQQNNILDNQKFQGQQLKTQESQQPQTNVQQDNYAGSVNNIEKLQSINFDEKYYKTDQVTHYIEHPIPFKSVLVQSNVSIPMYLTRQERKKLRRKRRMEKEKDKQDKIKLGLMPPPPNKVKINNMMNVLTNEAIQDPTHLESEVRKSMAERMQRHKERNEARKLTKEQKAEKSLRKLKRDSAIECRVALFRIENLSNGAHRFKVDKNAQQLQLHGLCLIPDRIDGFRVPALIVVEGGPKAIKFYKKLMLRRIKWDQSGLQQEDMIEQSQQGETQKKEDITDDQEASKQETSDNEEIKEEKKELTAKQTALQKMQKKHHHRHRQINPELFGNKCSLVWEGVIKDHNFNKWRVVDVRSEMEAKRALAERGVEYYYEMVMNYKDNE